MIKYGTEQSTDEKYKYKENNNVSANNDEQFKFV